MCLIGIVVFIVIMNQVICDDSVLKGNAFLDGLLHEIKTNRSAVYSIDPLSVPDVKGSNFETSELVVKGFSKLDREGDCKVSGLSYNNGMRLTCKMGTKDFTVEFKYRAKALFWFNGEGLLKVDKLSVELDVSFNAGTPSLENVKILKLGDFHIKKINGLSVLLNWMLRLITEKLINKSKEKIKESMKESITQSLKVLMKNKMLKLV